MKLNGKPLSLLTNKQSAKNKRQIFQDTIKKQYREIMPLMPPLYLFSESEQITSVSQSSRLSV